MGAQHQTVAETSPSNQAEAVHVRLLFVVYVAAAARAEPQAEEFYRVCL